MRVEKTDGPAADILQDKSIVNEHNQSAQRLLLAGTNKRIQGHPVLFEQIPNSVVQSPQPDLAINILQERAGSLGEGHAGQAVQ